MPVHIASMCKGDFAKSHALSGRLIFTQTKAAFIIDSNGMGTDFTPVKLSSRQEECWDGCTALANNDLDA